MVSKKDIDAVTPEKVRSGHTEQVSVSYEKVKLNVEAILFSYGDWISVNEIKESLGLDSQIIIKNALKELKEKFKENFTFHIEENETSQTDKVSEGLEIVSKKNSLNAKFRMALKDEFANVVEDLISNVEIPPKILKVLSVIAYEQPVTKTRLSEILGKSVKQEVSYLYRNKFLSYEKVGIGKYYRVTGKFYDYFKLDKDEDFKASADKNIKVFLEEPEQIVKTLQNDWFCKGLGIFDSLNLEKEEEK